MAISALEAAHRAASDVEQVAWVDRDDRVLGAMPRHQLREKGLIGRGTFILLFNSAGELCVHQRTLSKALYPGFWDVAAGGMVGANETYAESAARELAEELGVSGIPLTAHERFYFEGPQNHLWCGVFSGVWDGPLQVQPEEVQHAVFISVAEALRLSEQQPFCPDSLDALRRYLETL
ncbi:NUDIX hydrolase [Pseudomonas psychrophila]|uniref:NUDIX hydrolase n=1 Tax=Pseudomonas psychrophila TaxID=122355 RepID=UPI000300F5F8|nr:NUDIX hydrolase [Pseudomonas psychrophila]